MAEACYKSLRHYEWLANYRIKQGLLLYNIASKLYCFWHMCQMSKFMNPRAAWAYGFEDFMGKLSRSAAACVSGTPAKLVGKKLCENYCVALRLRLARMT